eukprot:TRINITY_DN6011_c0_g4_i1.p1 TRINITY_DN6011_c0_g4~~TRINITY_DN6011_c0_g4_i1.p1  ORF type:complete len:567 (-),score=162.42 TRINITY_DN6011_c0_g4_i1:352-2052(-)
MTEVNVQRKPTAPIAGQKTGTSGLRKKVAEFSSGNYLDNWVQSLFSSLKPDLDGNTLVVGGDGRYFNDIALQHIIRLAAGNGVAKLLIGQNGILSTPAVSAIIRARSAFGGIILTASHNPGGPENDFGIKYNSANGGPAAEEITEEIFKHTESISVLNMADIPEIDLATIAASTFSVEGKEFVVEIIDSIADYEANLRNVFDFEALRNFITSRPEFKYQFDALNGVVGPYVKRMLVEGLGASASSLSNCDPLPDFGGLHPDPNLTYAAGLVEKMQSGEYSFGAAWDGDGDRNMVLGSKFFVTPSDSVAIIAASAKEAIPYFSSGITAVARSMPTSAALDRVADALGIKLYEVPTGWKYFGSIMDHYEDAKTPNVICGEESFGTGSDHIREKDGMWATLAWLSILAHENKNAAEPVSVEDIVRRHWKKFGRNYYSRHDYETVESQAANDMMAHLVSLQNGGAIVGTQLGSFTVAYADEFEYTDAFTGALAKHQGIRFGFTDGSRMVFRLSGTGSSGATIRLYLEQYVDAGGDHDKDTQEALGELIAVALETSKIEQFTGRKGPTVIT